MDSDTAVADLDLADQTAAAPTAGADTASAADSGLQEGPGPSTSAEDQVEASLTMIDDLLKIMGEAWTEIEQLKQENARLSSLLSQREAARQTPGAQGVEVPAPAPPAAVQHGYEPGTILLVDDSKLLLMRYRQILEPLGYKVVGIAEDGKQGVGMALRLKPELVICDYQMPEMDGLGLIRALRASLPDAKVIICTGTTNAEPMRQFAAEGASAIVVKPIQLETFVRAVKKCMGKKLG